MGHPERAIPFCVKSYRLCDGAGTVLFECTDNHQTRNTVRLPRPATTAALRVELRECWGPVPRALFKVAVYPD